MCHNDLHKCLDVTKACSWTHAHPRVSFWASVSWANHPFYCIMHANLLADGLMSWRMTAIYLLISTYYMYLYCMHYYKNRHMCVQFTEWRRLFVDKLHAEALPCIMYKSTSPLCLSWLFSHFLQCSPLVFNRWASSVAFSLLLCQYTSICACNAPELFPGETSDNGQLSYDKVHGWLPLVSSQKRMERVLIVQ